MKKRVKGIIFIVILLALFTHANSSFAAQAGTLREKATAITSADVKAIDITKTNMTVNSSVSGLGIVTATGSYYKGNNTWKRMSVGTTYEFKYNSAFTIDNQSLDLIITIKPVEKASGGLVDIRVDSNNKMELWNEKTNVDISYKIVKTRDKHNSDKIFCLWLWRCRWCRLYIYNH